MPSHKTIELIGMSRNKFDFIIKDNSNEEKELIEQTLDQLEVYEYVMDEDDSLVESSTSDTCANNQPFGTIVSVDEDQEHPQKKHVWYYKIEAFINHVREINFDLIHVLGTCLSLDEMVIRFGGRSS
jgi:hypothetical protein